MRGYHYTIGATGDVLQHFFLLWLFHYFLYQSVHKINFMVVFVFLAKDRKVTKDTNYDIYLFEILVWARGPKIA